MLDNDNHPVLAVGGYLPIDDRVHRYDDEGWHVCAYQMRGYMREVQHEDFTQSLSGLI